MAGWKCVHLFFFLLIPLVFGQHSLECPSKQWSTINCESENKCSEQQFCLELVKESKQYGCCDRLSHCPETGMLAITGVDTKHRLKWEMNKDSLETGVWYTRNITINGEHRNAMCPTPLSYQLIGSEKEWMAVGFKEGGPKLTNCDVSSDCAEDEFCGHAHNPSYCPNDDLPEEFQNKCLDKSINGLPMQFCFKYPEIINGNLKMKRDRAGFDVCNEQKDCGNRSLCIFGSINGSFRSVNTEGETDGLTYNGICAHVKMCDPKKYVSEIAHLPKTLQSCAIGKDDSCDGEDDQCLPSSLQEINMCCASKSKRPKTRSDHTYWYWWIGGGVAFAALLIIATTVGVLLLRRYLKGKRRDEKMKRREKKERKRQRERRRLARMQRRMDTSRAADGDVAHVDPLQPTASPSPSTAATPTTATTATPSVSVDSTQSTVSLMVEKTQDGEAFVSYSGSFEGFYQLSKENQKTLLAETEALKKEMAENTDFFYW